MKRKPRRKSRQKDIKKSMSLKLPGDYPWKILNKVCLDLEEYLNVDEFKMVNEIVIKRDFEGYLKLNEEWGLQSTVSTDTSVPKLRVKYLLASLIKKFRFETDKEKRIARATEIFFAAESQCKTYNQVGYKSLENPETEWGVEILHYARLFLRKLLGPELPGHKELLERARHGPGATLGTRNGNTSQYHKYAEWPYTCTNDAFRYARFAIETDQRWIGALQDDYRARFGIQKQMPLDLGVFWSTVIEVTDSNRIAFVPKDAQKERTIAIEPSLNLYLQLGVDGFIRRRLKRFGVNLDSQEKNQELARLGSLCDGDDSLITIDLSAASDSISTKLVELLFPTDWCSYLMDLRSPKGYFEGDISVNYEKISSMGNGYTFAIESAIFTALIYAVMKAGGGTFNHDEFAVFGDDLILPKRLRFKMVEALRLAGFSVNLEKTFFDGPIRESCGTDWIRGAPLRPVFLKETPSDVMGLFTDYNRLKRLFALRWGLEESETLELLKRWIPDKAMCLTGPLSDESFDSYIHTELPEKGKYSDCVYKFQRLIVRPLPRKGTNFLFRKLMHDLRGVPIPLQKWEKVRGAGSRFIVTSRNAMTMGKTSSVADIWRSKYTEYYPTHLHDTR